MQEEHTSSSCSAWGYRYPQQSKSPGDTVIIFPPLLALIWLRSGSQWQFRHHFDLDPFLATWNETGALSGRGFHMLLALEMLHIICRTDRQGSFRRQRGEESHKQRQCWWHIIPPKQQSLGQGPCDSRQTRGRHDGGAYSEVQPPRKLLTEASIPAFIYDSFTCPKQPVWLA